MNKYVTGFLGAAAALTMLAGCTTYDRTKDQFTQPVVKDVKKGMSRSQVAQIAGKPSSEVSMIHARGTCQTYILGQRDGKTETYFVALDDTGHVMNSGYQTCAEYDTDPQAPKQ
ncbi:MULTISPECIES: osmotically-inducible lipoprotein OsmE [Pseudocitrobacter]|uniref:Beta-barrel assembly machine subunit BamE n=1 Tax=Pseudocitrobacter faecalis TaxID=1398493 RepID=A0ABX9FT61_9ENTR|nr:MULTISPECIES: osmotically-inducible lipoprotein OsmE [Pseudocitrobacter]MEB4673863.1 osmotically-inducible lipoprotein OsmE [Enterobacteriaceae bacterium G50]RAU45602.1 osmotically-inducible lipoprotein OsmE [Pseudocitrobacter sp. RIT 415]RBP09607.1 Beta-barrel assembly machine subunit BamE [Pseudocitrobacter faecalis]UYW74982.1 osmotically-inducible lipoprotein OsmE [Pseudocitrobacter faecalis]GHD91923.1 transcriptional regulator [Pseudocitrobacter faecalis]